MFVFPVRPLRDGIFIDIIDRNITQKDLGGGKVLHLISDDDFSGPHDPLDGGKHSGIRPRWARVLALGPEVTEVRIGDLVLCDELKWSRKMPLGRDGQEIVYFWNIKATDILLIDDNGLSKDYAKAFKANTARADYLKDFQTKMSRMELTVGHL